MQLACLHRSMGTRFWNQFTLRNESYYSGIWFSKPQVPRRLSRRYCLDFILSSNVSNGPNFSDLRYLDSYLGT